MLDQKEIYWRQRSKQLWLQAGEKNTKYFHASCNKRRRNNYIQKLMNEDGEWFNWQCGLQTLIRDYFQNLFTAAQTQTDDVLNCITSTVSEQQNRFLLAAVSD